MNKSEKGVLFSYLWQSVTIYQIANFFKLHSREQHCNYCKSMGLKKKRGFFLTRTRIFAPLGRTEKPTKIDCNTPRSTQSIDGVVAVIKISKTSQDNASQPV